MEQQIMTPETERRIKNLTVRILRNMIDAATGEDIVFRTRAKYSLTDVPVVMFDSILKSLGIEPQFSTRTRARYYDVKELRAALTRLTQ